MGAMIQSEADLSLLMPCILCRSE